MPLWKELDMHVGSTDQSRLLLRVFGRSWFWVQFSSLQGKHASRVSRCLDFYEVCRLRQDITDYTIWHCIRVNESNTIQVTLHPIQNLQFLPPPLHQPSPFRQAYAGGLFESPLKTPYLDYVLVLAGSASLGKTESTSTHSTH